MTNQEIKQRLNELAEIKYRDFSRRLLPGVENILGVRLPNLRKLAREFASGDWREFLAQASDNSFEEIMLQGMVISSAECELSEKIALVANFVPKIDNWAVCDSFSWKLKNSEKAQVWEFLQPYFNSNEEFEVRFATVMILGNFIEAEYLPQIFAIFNRVKSQAYYAEMAIAWVVSMIFVKFPDETLEFLRQNNLSERTFRKSLQKIIESRQASDEQKKLIRQMRKDFNDSRDR